MKSKLNQLWSPWRATYVTSAKQPEDSPYSTNISCFLCESKKLAENAESLVIHKGEHNFIILNKYPYSTGHLLVVPYEHEANLLNLSKESRNESTDLIDLSIEKLIGEYNPNGFNVGMNLGKAAGAGVPNHIHIHVVPRWEGDTNFMPVTGETKVQPENLETTYNRLRQHWI